MSDDGSSTLRAVPCDARRVRPDYERVPHNCAIAHAVCATLEELENGDYVVVTGIVEAGSPPEPADVPIVDFGRQYRSVRSSPGA